MNLVDSGIDLTEDLVMDFVDLGVNFVYFGANFLDLKMGSGNLRMDLEMGFAGLEIDFVDEYVEGIAQPPIGILDCGPFVVAYVEYFSDGLQVPNDGLDAGLLHKYYATLLWKYGKAKAQKAYTRDIKDPRRSKWNFIAPDEEQLIHIE
ncbi:hypothetical protein BC332_19278 [Capsicum chinense]|nr:hypothetical protein BC332_19278 [Capsicum chinense]